MTQDEVMWKGARKAYEAYCASQWDNSLPIWAELTDDIKRSWRSTAHALIVFSMGIEYDSFAGTWTFTGQGKGKAINHVSVGA